MPRRDKKIAPMPGIRIDIYWISGRLLSSMNIRAPSVKLHDAVRKCLCNVQIPTTTEYIIVHSEERCVGREMWEVNDADVGMNSSPHLETDSRITILFPSAACEINCGICGSPCETRSVGHQIHACRHHHIGYSVHPGMEERTRWQHVDCFLNDYDLWKDTIEREMKIWRDEWVANNKESGYNFLINNVTITDDHMHAMVKALRPHRLNALESWKQIVYRMAIETCYEKRDLCHIAATSLPEREREKERHETTTTTTPSMELASFSLSVE